MRAGILILLLSISFELWADRTEGRSADQDTCLNGECAQTRFSRRRTDDPNRDRAIVESIMGNGTPASLQDTGAVPEGAKDL